MSELTRDELFLERLRHSAVAASNLTTKLTWLVERQPHGGSEQEQRLRLIEGNLADCLQWASRIADFAGKGDKP